eukprot:763252-Hanusia_phi.AAC.4
MRPGARKQAVVMSDKEDFLNRDVGGFTQKQRFREEIESPFRKIRLFLFPAAAASAALGAFIAGTRLLAMSTGVTGYDFDQTLQNFGVDVLGATAFALLYWNDINARDRDLLRIARSGKLSTLTLKIASETGREAALPMKAFRKQRRIAIIAGGKDVVQVAREMARAGAEDLTQVGAIVLPLQLDQVDSLDPAEVEVLRKAVGVPENPGGEEQDPDALLPCLAAPLFVEKWKDWIQDEQKRAVEQVRETGLALPSPVLTPFLQGPRSQERLHHLRGEERIHQEAICWSPLLVLHTFLPPSPPPSTKLILPLPSLPSVHASVCRPNQHRQSALAEDTKARNRPYGSLLSLPLGSLLTDKLALQECQSSTRREQHQELSLSLSSLPGSLLLFYQDTRGPFFSPAHAWWPILSLLEFRMIPCPRADECRQIGLSARQQLSLPARQPLLAHRVRVRSHPPVRGFAASRSPRTCLLSGIRDSAAATRGGRTMLVAQATANQVADILRPLAQVQQHGAHHSPAPPAPVKL